MVTLSGNAADRPEEQPESMRAFRVGSLAHLVPDITDWEWEQMDREFRAQFRDDELIS